MTNQLKKRLLQNVFVSAAALSILSYDVSFALAGPQSFGGNDNDRHTDSPIKHVIVIVGENRTFDHIFATYQSPRGHHVDNLLSKGIIDINGKPGPNYGVTTAVLGPRYDDLSDQPRRQGGLRHVDQSAAAAGDLLCSPAALSQHLRSQLRRRDQRPRRGSECRFSHEPDIYASPAGGRRIAATERATAHGLLLVAARLGAAHDGLNRHPGGFARHAHHQQLPPNGLPSGVYPLVCGPNAPTLNNVPVCTAGQSLYDTYGGSPVHRFYQMWQELDCDANKATTSQSLGMPGRPFPLG